jgi:integrase
MEKSRNLRFCCCASILENLKQNTCGSFQAQNFTLDAGGLLLRSLQSMEFHSLLRFNKPVHIRQYYDCRKNAKIGANREKALFSHIGNMARNWGYTDQPNPCAGIKGFTEKGRAEIYIEEDKFLAVHNAASQPLKDELDLAYLTGQRPSDVLNMTESDIRDNSINIIQRKTGKKLRISIEGELAKLIDRIHARNTTFKVHSLQLIVDSHGQPFTYHMLRGYFDSARTATGIDKDNFQLGDLRGKAATDKAKSTGDIRQAQQQLGHSTIGMTKHYIRGCKGEKVTPTKYEKSEFFIPQKEKRPNKIKPSRKSENQHLRNIKLRNILFYY